MRWYSILMVSVALAVGLVVVTSIPRGEIRWALLQGSEADIDSPSLAVVTEGELNAFESALNVDSLENDIEDRFSAGYKIMSLGFEFDSATGGDKKYFGVVGFAAAGGSMKIIKYTFTKKASPPDTFEKREVTPDPNPSWDTMVVPDQVSFDYLLHVLSERPIELNDNLVPRDLVEIWLEHQTTPTDKVKAFFKYKDATSTRTILCWSVHNGNSNFGAINVVD